ncbi:hypothetical protein MRX96_021769 [Rhipicephalus microplus]
MFVVLGVTGGGPGHAQASTPSNEVVVRGSSCNYKLVPMFVLNSGLFRSFGLCDDLTSLRGCCPGDPCQDRQCSDGVDAETTRYVGPSPWRFGSVIFLGFFIKLSGILFILVGFNSATPGLRLLGFVLIPLGIVVFSGGVLWAAMESWRYRAALMAIHALDPSGGVRGLPERDVHGPMAGLEPVQFSKYPVVLPVYAAPTQAS